MDHRLRFAPEILARLGEELVPHADLGVMELVRNAYDADAASCWIKLRAAATPGGNLEISDDGDGMSREQLAEGFLLIGKSSKASDPITESGRRRVGEKGLGRLAALRLGKQVEVQSISKLEPGQENCLTIDWNLIDASEAVEDVSLPILSAPSSKGPGTTISISGLRDGLSENDVQRLARSLLMLTGPFADETAFRVSCDAPEFADLAELIKADLFSQSEFRLEAELDNEGQTRATLYNWRNEVEFQGDHPDVALTRAGNRRMVPPRFFAPVAKFEMWMFNLNPQASKEVRRAQQNTSELRRWLAQVGGVHLFHRGLRVQPYGDPGDDWLGINLRRAGSPEVRPSTNNSVGRLIVEDPTGELRPKTDRSGFVNSPAFIELQEFAKRALDWAAAKRLEQREQRRSGAVAKVRERVVEKSNRFEALVESISPSDEGALPLGELIGSSAVESLASAAREMFAAQKEEIEALREDLLLYRTLATVGTSTAVFAHEAMRPAARIINEIKTVGRRIKTKVTSDVFQLEFKEPIDAAVDSAKTVMTFTKLPLNLLERRKREVADIEIDEACQAIVQLFSRYLDERSIQVKFDLRAPRSLVRTTVADIESILSNLLANAAHAFTRKDAVAQERVIRISTRAVGSQIEISVDDSGPGIVGLPLREIWLPGRTTRENGTGLGLTIVRDIVADLKGTQEARTQGELGGARFVIRLPATLNGHS